MTITQTVEIPANSRSITIDIPREVPSGPAQVIIQFPAPDKSSVPETEKGQSKSEAFREVLRQTQGAWKNTPWTNHLEDVRALRDEWER